MSVVYANPEPETPSSLRNKMIESVTRKSSQKPWTLVTSVVEETSFSEDEVRKTLKRLMLKRELEIASTGEVRIPSK